MTSFVGIDLGLDGGIASYVPELDFLNAVVMPTITVKRGKKMKRELDTYNVVATLRGFNPTHVYIETVGAMPGQGVSSTFSFGRGVGQIEGILAALEIPYSTVSPNVWLKAMKVRGGKDGSRFRAAQLFPSQSAEFSRAKDEGVAEAALIARWGADNYAGAK